MDVKSNETPKRDGEGESNDENDNSLVGKFKSIISNTPLSKWFRKEATPRRRFEIDDDDDDDDDDEDVHQPPSKKVKLPPEAVAGPSGLQHRKKVFNSTEICNGHKDSDSEESTSGYSSVARIESKERMCESRAESKQASPVQGGNDSGIFNESSKLMMSRSLFMEKSTLNANRNTSLSTRRPTFNVTSFNSPSFIDNTVSTQNIVNSPFYKGKTTFGGASAYHQSLTKKNLNNAIQMRPVNKPSEKMALGKTAKRILETLEQYNSPVNDAKKIPKRGVGPYSRELHVPNVVDLLKQKRKMHLQNTTEAVKKIAKDSKSLLNIESYKLGNEDNNPTNDKNVTVGGKIKTKITSTRSQKNYTNEICPEVNLPEISLPIKVLPKFDVVVPAPLPSPVKKPEKLIKELPKTETEPKPLETTEFKFADPVIIAENMRSIIAVNNFKFSEPLSKKLNETNIVNFKMPENKAPTLVLKNKNNGENLIKTAPVLKTGSVLDALCKKPESNDLMDKFKPAADTWECSVCMIRNNIDKTTCAACETPKNKPEVKKQQSLPNFDKSFKMGTDKWECTSCLVRNDNTESKCIACTAPKPGSKPIINDLSKTFKPPSNTWECPVCMIRNENSVNKCVACTSPNPSSKETIKKTWTCSSCLVKNDENVTKCIACDTNKQDFGNSFSLKKDEWECEVCMVRNKTENTKCQCCEATKPGTTLKELNKPIISSFNFGINKSTTFSFGIPPTSNDSKSEPAKAISTTNLFDMSKSTTNFSFGVKANENKSVEEEQPVKENDAVKFSVATTANNVNVNAEAKTTSATTVSATKPTFSFGTVTTNKVDTNTNNKQQIPMFNFGNAKPLTEVKPSVSVITTTTVPATIPKEEQSVTSTSAFKLSDSTNLTPTFGQIQPTNTNNNNFQINFRPPEQKNVSFGQISAIVTTSTPTVTFGQPPPKVAGVVTPATTTTTSASAGFSFTPSTAPNFNFSTQKPGEIIKPTFGSNGGFNFGSTSSTANTQPSSSSGFNFGTSSNVPLQTSFNFGASATSTAGAPSSGAGGFNFSGAAVTVAPAFDPNVKPMFNFSEGQITSFSAQSTGDTGGLAQRKIRKAIRRTHR